MMKALYINLRNINGVKKWFVSKVVYELIEMFDHGHIVENFYDNHLLPIDTDKKGNLYILSSKKDHLCRTKVLYHPKIIANNKNTIKITLEGIQQKQIKCVTTAESVVRDNRRCEEKLLDILPLPLDTVITEEKFIDISLDKMHKTKIPMLTAFIKIRMNSNFNTHVVIASLKVNPVDVRNKVVDKKQRDSCCLSKLIRLDH